MIQNVWFGVRKKMNEEEMRRRIEEARRAMGNPPQGTPKRDSGNSPTQSVPATQRNSSSIAGNRQQANKRKQKGGNKDNRPSNRREQSKSTPSSRLPPLANAAISMASAIVCLVTVAAILLSFFNTVDYSEVVFPSGYWGKLGGAFIQFAPTTFLPLASNFRRRQKYWPMLASYGAFVLLSFVDYATNQMWYNTFMLPSVPIEQHSIAIPISVIVMASVVVAEELLLHMIPQTAEYFGYFGEDVGLWRSTPKILRATAGLKLV